MLKIKYILSSLLLASGFLIGANSAFANANCDCSGPAECTCVECSCGNCAKCLNIKI